MKNQVRKQVLVCTAATVLSTVACAEIMDRPVGIKIGQRMTLKPYVAFSFTYDSNADGGSDGDQNTYWSVTPGFGLDYKGENWSLSATGSYNYNAYNRKRQGSQNDYHGISEAILYRWSNAPAGERGWSLMLTQRYQKTYEDNDFEGGRDYGSDRQNFNFAGSLQRRFGEGLHADVNGQYYWLDYNRNNHTGTTSSGLYGWERAQAGGEIGWAPSRWTDILLTGTYQHFHQDNNKNSYYTQYGNRPSSTSKGYTVQGGLGSFATDRITYRVLAGWSRFEYGGGSNGKTSNGFTYSVSGNWTISETWKTMLLASSYYRPSETEYGSSRRVDALSWGIAHSMVQGKLNATFNVNYNHQTPEYSWSSDGHESGGNYTLDTLNFRLGLNYTLNRFFSIFASAAYRDSISSGSSSSSSNYTYDRYSLTTGVRLTY